MTGTQMFGRTTVPPPATGAAGVTSPAAPYYQGTPAAAPPATIAPSSSAPAYDPPAGSFEPNTSSSHDSPNNLRWTRSLADQNDGSGTGESAAQLASHHEPVTDEGPANEVYVNAPHEEPAPEARLTVPTGRPPSNGSVGGDAPDNDAAANVTSVSAETTALRIIEPSGPDEGLVELVSSPATTGRTVAASADDLNHSGVRFASGRPAAPPGATTTAGPTRRAAPYGHDAGYSWLKGRLTRSAETGGWELRYAPPGRDADRYGGTLPLAETSALDDFRDGDFIAVQGAIATAGSTVQPQYEVERVKPLKFN